MGVHYKYSRINAVTQINGVISIPRGEFWVSMIESNQPIQLSDRMDTIYHHCRPIQYYNISILHNLQPSCCCQTQIGAGVWKYNNCSQNHWHIIFIKITHIYMTKLRGFFYLKTSLLIGIILKWNSCLTRGITRFRMVKKWFPQNTFFSWFLTGRAFIMVYYIIKLDLEFQLVIGPPKPLKTAKNVNFWKMENYSFWPKSWLFLA